MSSRRITGAEISLKSTQIDNSIPAEKFTFVTECCPDLDGGEILEERLEVEGGELRTPPAARLLVQSVSDTKQGLLH